MVLGLDLGTTNVKVVAVDRNGQVLREALRPVSLCHANNGVVEQDIGEIWQAASEALRAVAGAVDPAQVEAIGVSSQGGAIQLLDANRRPVGRVISWLDQRAEPDARELWRRFGTDWFLERTGHRRAWVAAGQVARLRREAPELLSAPNQVGFVGDLIVERLCGKARHDGTSAALTLLYDPKQRTYASDLLTILGLHKEQLPEIVPAKARAGSLLPEVAISLGLPPKIPVSAAIHDQYASALSAGAIEAGNVMVGTGTVWVLLAVSSTFPQPVSENSLISHHLIDGLYGQIISLVNGGSAFQWALDLCGLNNIRSTDLERLITQVPAGCDGLRAWPLFASRGAAGSACGTGGRLDGLQLSHGRGHVLRAILEGLSFELRRHLEILQDFGTSPTELILAGRAAASPAASEIICNVTGLPLTCAGAESGSAHGAAILAQSIVHPDSSLRDLSRQLRSCTGNIFPGKDKALYARQYATYMESLSTQA